MVHQRVRLGLLSVLVEADHAEFTYLRQALELSDGNLNRHLAVLAEAGYVQSHRDMSDRRPRTWVSITPAGRRAFHSELAALQALVRAHQAGDGQGEPGPAGRRQGEPQASRNGPSPEDRP
ncbi:MAG: winged helix-turn-helix domain-containing protein [Acidimicrobiales bacterium]